MHFSIDATFIVNLLILVSAIGYGYTKVPPSPVRRIFLPALCFKIFCSVAFGLMYFFYFREGDTIGFYNQALDLAKLPLDTYLKEVFLTSIPFDKRSVLPVVKITSLALLATGQNYWLAAVYFGLFSFAGAYYFIHQLVKAYPTIALPAIVSFLFVPSLVFWSSGILKETLVFGLIMFLAGFYLRFHFCRKFNYWHVVLAIFGGWLMVKLKYYIAAVCLPILLILFILSVLEKYEASGRLKPSSKYWIVALAAIGVVFLAINLQYNLNPTRLFSVITANQQEVVEMSGHKNAIQYFDQTKSAWLVLPNLFIACFSGLFRPLFFDSIHLPQALAIIENLVVLVLFLASFRRKLSINAEDKPLLFGALVYILILASLLAYSSPNFGALSRYKVYYMPFFLLLILHKNPMLLLFQNKSE
ncbi:MAG: hypothetical protein RIG77_11435 [Cyclobacteriaceae bacterium]